MTAGNYFQELCFQRLLTITLEILSNNVLARMKIQLMLPILSVKLIIWMNTNYHVHPWRRKKKKEKERQRNPANPTKIKTKTKNQTQTTNKGQRDNLSSESFKVSYLAFQLSLLLSDKAAHHFHSDTFVLYLFILQVWMHFPTCQPYFVSMGGLHYRHEGWQDIMYIR